MQLSAEKCCIKKSYIKFDIAQFRSYYVRGVGSPFVDSCKDLDIIVDTGLKFHGYIRSIVEKSSGISVNLLNSTFCCSREFMLTLNNRRILRMFCADHCTKQNVATFGGRGVCMSLSRTGLNYVFLPSLNDFSLCYRIFNKLNP